VAGEVLDALAQGGAGVLPQGKKLLGQVSLGSGQGLRRETGPGWWFGFVVAHLRLIKMLGI
jgi:hypothetical protein